MITRNGNIITENNKVIEPYIDIFSLNPKIVISASKDIVRSDNEFQNITRNFAKTGDGVGENYYRTNIIGSRPAYSNTGSIITLDDNFAKLQGGGYSLVLHIKTPLIAPIVTETIYFESEGGGGIGGQTVSISINATIINILVTQFNSTINLSHNINYTLDKEYIITIVGNLTSYCKLYIDSSLILNNTFGNPRLPYFGNNLLNLQQSSTFKANIMRTGEELTETQVLQINKKINDLGYL